jgi:DNA-binding FrmR family transcriptional regulator
MKEKEVCKDITIQYNRLKGQFLGIEKMIKEGRDVMSIIQQISALRAGLSKLGVEILKDETSTCFNKKSKKEKMDKFEELVSTFFKIT